MTPRRRAARLTAQSRRRTLGTREPFTRADPREERRQYYREAERTLLDIERLEAIVTDPRVYQLAQLIPPRRVGGPGRPNDFPDHIWVIFLAVRGMIGSARHAIEFLQHRVHWQITVEGVRAILGDEAADGLPSEGPTRGRWNHHKERLARHLPALIEAFEEGAVEQALEQGCFDPSVRFSLKNPQRSQFIVGDGTVPLSPVDPPAKGDRSTADSAASWHVEAGEDSGNYVYGSKYVFLSSRPDSSPHSRIVLSVRRVPKGKGYGGEMGIALPTVFEIAKRAGNAQGIVWDGALRGSDRDKCYKAGLMAVAPHHKGARRRRLDRVTHCGCPGGHDIWTVKGALHERSITDTGRKHFEALPVIKREHRDTRWYIVVALPCGIEHRERLDKTAEDTRREFNRPEHLLPYSPDTAEYERAYGWRPDAESLNARFDATLWNRRMIAYSESQQDLVMLGFALAQNAVSAAVHRRKVAPAKAA